MFNCTACGGTYSATTPDGLDYFHVCPDSIVVGTERQPVANPRNENVLPGLAHIMEGGILKTFRAVPNVEERGRFNYVEAKLGIIAEGAGRTEVKK